MGKDLSTVAPTTREELRLKSKKELRAEAASRGISAKLIDEYVCDEMDKEHFIGLILSKMAPPDVRGSSRSADSMHLRNSRPRLATEREHSFDTTLPLGFHVDAHRNVVLVESDQQAAAFGIVAGLRVTTVDGLRLNDSELESVMRAGSWAGRYSILIAFEEVERLTSAAADELGRIEATLDRITHAQAQRSRVYVPSVASHGTGLLVPYLSFS